MARTRSTAFSSLNVLMEKIAKRCRDKQVLVTTHSSFVLNKLGLGDLILLTPTGGARIGDLPADTAECSSQVQPHRCGNTLDPDI
jgi:putative ATP-dependent endonuclease of the OLD family